MLIINFTTMKKMKKAMAKVEGSKADMVLDKAAAAKVIKKGAKMLMKKNTKLTK